MCQLKLGSVKGSILEIPQQEGIAMTIAKKKMSHSLDATDLIVHCLAKLSTKKD